MTKKNELSQSNLPKKTAELLDLLNRKTSYGKVAIEMSNEQLCTETGWSMATAKRHLAALIEAGLIEVKTEFKAEKQCRCRMIFVKQPESPKAKQVDDSAENKSYVELVQEKINALVAKTNDYDEAKLREQLSEQLSEPRSVIFSIGESDLVEETWLKLFDLAVLKGLKEQLETGDFLDQLCLGTLYFRWYCIQRDGLIDFRDCFLRHLKSNIMLCKPNYVLKEMPRLSEVLDPDNYLHKSACKELVDRAICAFNTHPYCKFGLELIPSEFEFEYEGKKVLIESCIFDYMQKNGLGPYANGGFTFYFEPIFNALRSLHGQTFTAKDFEQALQEAIDFCQEIDKKAKNNGVIGLANVVLGQLLLERAKSKKINLQLQSSLFESGIGIPPVNNADDLIFRNSGLDQSRAEYLQEFCDSFVYAINRGLKIYNKPACQFAHPSPAVYDLRAYAQNVKWGQYVNPASLTFDFSRYHLDMRALAKDPNGFYQPLVDESEWLEYVWFDMAYRLFVDPENGLFGNINNLHPDGSNLVDWFVGDSGIRRGIVTDLYSVYYEDMSVLAKQIKTSFRCGSRSARQFVIGTVCKDLTQICVEYLNPLLYVYRDPRGQSLDYAKDKVARIIYDFAMQVNNFNKYIFGRYSPDPSQVLTAELIIKKTAPIYSDIDSLIPYMVLKEPSFLMIKAQALSLLCLEKQGVPKTKLFDNNPAKLYCALAEREEDQYKWRSICRSYLPKDYSIYVD